MSDRTDVEERQLKDLLNECLAVFEGGECLEDFESSWAIFVIQDLVDTFNTRKSQIEQRKEGRAFIQSLKEIRGNPVDDVILKRKTFAQGQEGFHYMAEVQSLGVYIDAKEGDEEE